MDAEVAIPVEKYITKTVMNPVKKTDQGSSLIEVLVALLVSAIGFLGIGATQTYNLKMASTSYYRSVATVLAQNMSERIHLYSEIVNVSANKRKMFECYSCILDQRYQNDVRNWQSLINGISSAEKSNASTRVNLLPDGEGSVERVGNTYSIKVRWSALSRSGENMTVAEEEYILVVKI